MLVTFLLTMGLISLCVAIHYEALYRLGGFVEGLRISARQQVVVGVLLAIAAHVVEIYIFAGGYYYALYYDTIGGFTGEAKMEDYFDCVYLSFVTYTTLGFGDIIPHGWVRFMVGIEAMLGLVQIAWTASYLYMQMQDKWGHGAISGPAASKRGSKRGSSRG